MKPLASPAMTPLIEPERISPMPMSGRQIAAVMRWAMLAPALYSSASAGTTVTPARPPRSLTWSVNPLTRP